jgi:branched-chain amino acid transport system ATP-binding protein
MTGNILELSAVTISFGGVTAVDRVSLELQYGRIMGLIGPNGAGKTTLLNAVSGFNRVSSGSIRFAENEVTTLRPVKRTLAGLGRTFQTPQVFDELTVLENLVVAKSGKHKRSSAEPRAIETLIAVGLEGLAHSPTRRLTTVQRRFLEIGRALMMETLLLLMDEPATGLRESEIDELIGLVSSLSGSRGMSCLIVSHDMPLVRECCSEVAALDRGQLIARGAPEEVLQNPHVVEAYFGTPNPEVGNA